VEGVGFYQKGRRGMWRQRNLIEEEKIEQEEEIARLNYKDRQNLSNRDYD